MQTLQFVQQMRCEPYPFTPRNLHLLSDHGMTRVLAGETDQTWDDLMALRKQWNSFGVFLIEISSLKEFSFPSNGGTFYANTFTTRDLDRHRDALANLIERGAIDRTPTPTAAHLNEAETSQAMKRIKHLLGCRPIVWVSHIRPPDDAGQEYELVRTVRKNLADRLKAVAGRLGDTFFDPSKIVKDVGFDTFYADDIDHLSPVGAQALADIYGRLTKVD